MKLYKEILEGIRPTDYFIEINQETTNAWYGHFDIHYELKLFNKQSEEVGLIYYTLTRIDDVDFAAAVDKPQFYISIDWINVKPQFQRQGYAAQMVEALLKEYNIDYSTQLFWHRLYEDGKRLKIFFDNKYGKNIRDSKFRERLGFSSTPED